MSPQSVPGPDAITGFPRVSGDEPQVIGRYGTVCWFSPRERG